MGETCVEHSSVLGEKAERGSEGRKTVGVVLGVFSYYFCFLTLQLLSQVNGLQIPENGLAPKQTYN